MGNTSARPHPRSKHKKQVHWKAADRPGPPGKPQLVAESELTPDVVTIKWDPPRYDGGSPIIGYLVEHRRHGSPHWVRATPLLVQFTELSLSGLEPGWRYQFRVTAENAVGLSQPGQLSELLTVTLQRSAITAPRFIEEISDTTALENEKIEFTVNFVGQPTSTICWFKDGFEIFSSRRIRIITENEQSTLTIHQAALSDEGEIKCTATNRAGYATTKAKLNLEAPPSIRLPRQYEDGLLFELGEVIKLKVSIAGRPTPLIFWTHNNESINDSERYEIETTDKYSSIRIQEAQRDDRGEYQIKATNKLGDTTSSFLVTVTDKPSPPARARVIMTLGRSVTLSWNLPTDDGGCKIGNYIVEYFRIGWDVWLKAATCRQLSTTIGDLIEGSEYKFRIKAESPYGVSEPSEETEVIFIPDPKRGILVPSERSRSQPRDIFGNHPAAQRKPRSQSSSRTENRPTTPVQFYDGGIPVRPARTKIKSPTLSPEPSPLVTRRNIPVINKSIFDRTSMARDMAYGSPEINLKLIEDDVNESEATYHSDRLSQLTTAAVKSTVNVIHHQNYSGSNGNGFIKPEPSPRLGRKKFAQVQDVSEKLDEASNPVGFPNLTGDAQNRSGEDLRPVRGARESLNSTGEFSFSTESSYSSSDSLDPSHERSTSGLRFPTSSRDASSAAYRFPSPDGRFVGAGGRPQGPIGRPQSPTGRPLDRTGRPLSPTGRPLSPTGRPLSPASRPLSPASRPLSPTGRPASPIGRPQSPIDGSKQARRILSPTRRVTNSARKALSPVRRVVSPVGGISSLGNGGLGSGEVSNLGEEARSVERVSSPFERVSSPGGKISSAVGRTPSSVGGAPSPVGGAPSSFGRASSPASPESRVRSPTHKSASSGRRFPSPTRRSSSLDRDPARRSPSPTRKNYSSPFSQNSSTWENYPTWETSGYSTSLNSEMSPNASASSHTTTSPFAATPLNSTKSSSSKFSKPARSSSPARNRSPSPSRSSKSRSPSPIKSTEPKYDINFPKLPRNESETLSNSSEFMLVLLPDKERGRGSDSEFKFDFDETSVPPPMSLSAPELGTGRILFEPLRSSVSSSELLHEHAMARFYEALIAEEAEMEKRETKSMDIPKIQINSKDDQIIVGLERKNSTRRRHSGGLSNPQHLWSQRRHSLRNSHDLTDIPENNLRKFPALLDNHVVENFSKATVEEKREIFSTRQRSESEEREEEEFEKVRAKMALKSQQTRKKVDVIDEDEWDEESSESEREDHAFYVDDEEDEEIYNPRGRVLRNKSDEPFEILTKPNPLPDPNFKPKPILKTARSGKEDKVIPAKPIRKSINTNTRQRSLSVSPQTNNNAKEVHCELERQRSFSLFPQTDTEQHKTKVSKMKKRGSSPSVPYRRISAVAEISGMTAASVAMPQPERKPPIQKRKSEDEIKVVVDHYGDILKSYGQKKQIIPKVYLNADDLKAAAEKQSNEELHEVEKSFESSASADENDDEELIVPDTRRRSFVVEASTALLRSVKERVSAAFMKDEPEDDIIPPETDLMLLNQRRGSAQSSKRRVSKTPNKLEAPKVTKKSSPSKSPTRGENWSNLRAHSPSPQSGKPLVTNLRRNSLTPPTAQFRRNSFSSITSSSKQKTKECTTQTSGYDDVAGDPKKNILLAARQEELSAKAEFKVRTTVDYITDLAMFVVACWLYLFQNELLAIPVLAIMVYRQLKEEIKKKMPGWLLGKKKVKRK